MKLSVSVPDELVARMDETRGDVGRSGFVQRALRNELGGGEHRAFPVSRGVSRGLVDREVVASVGTVLRVLPARPVGSGFTVVDGDAA